MQEPTPRNEVSRVFLLAFRGAEIFYSTAEDRIFSALALSPVDEIHPESRAEPAKSERKGLFQ